MRVLGLVIALCAACAESNPPDAPVTPGAPTWTPMPTGPSSPTCGPQPAPPAAPTAPRCSNESLKDGQTWHDQLNVQIGSGAFTRIDCPRMRFHGQDTPNCVVKSVGGHVRGACCPPGHTEPTDPECVGEGTVDEMFSRQRVWEWCNKDRPPSQPCEPCVWVTGAQR